MHIDLGQFRATFYVEAEEHLQLMEAALLELENRPTDGELLNTVFRAAHSIKGASTTFGVDEVGKFTHVLENLLERLRDGELTANTELIELLLTSVDVIHGLVANAKDGQALPENLQDVFGQLRNVNGNGGEEAASHNALLAAAMPQASSSSKLFRVTLQPSREFFHFGQDPLLLLRELSELGRLRNVVVDDSQLPPLAEINPELCYLSWTIELEGTVDKQAIDDVFMFLDDGSRYSIEVDAMADSEGQPVDSLTSPQTVDTMPATETASSNPSVGAARQVGAEPKPGSSRNSTGGEFETVRVDRQRLDDLINQIGELVIGASMVDQEVSAIADGRPLESLTSLGKIVRDLQEMSLSLRMVPLAATFQKMQRVVRDVAKKVGKKIDFITEGDETELDKTVVDQISDPLVHMVRNAVDHGIEKSEDRIAAGKSAEGQVKLSAFQQGGNVYLELQDDGRGLDRKRILEKAVQRGLVAPDANLSDSEICSLIFQPGFSTAAEVTDVSGRGVGMDVVRRNVELLQGSVSIRSEEGKGSVLTVRLPLTLAILDGLLIRLSEEVFVIPLQSVIESISVPAKEVQRIVEVGEVIQLRGEVLPLLRLHRLLNMPASERASNHQRLLVIVEDQGRRFALEVDELLGQQQVVIKNLETNFRKIPGVAGATILGDGRVALILDAYGVATLDAQACNGGSSTSLNDMCVESYESTNQP